MEFNTPFLLVNSQKNGIDRIYSIRNLIQLDMVYGPLKKNGTPKELTGEPYEAGNSQVRF